MKRRTLSDCLNQGLKNPLKDAIESQRKKAVWEKGKVVTGLDYNQYRLDEFNNTMKYSEYGNRNSRFGWEIDHIMPLSLGGSHTLQNLRPLNALMNARLGGMLGSPKNSYKKSKF